MLKKLEKEQGSIAIILALAFTVLLGFCALVVDTGMIYIQAQKLQNAMDAAALAAAQDLPNISLALIDAEQYAQQNGISPSEIEVSFTDENNTVTVTGKRTVNYYFAQVLGYKSGTVSRTASATQASMGAAFNYALFSGSKTSELVLNGSSQYVGGSSHTNYSFDGNGSKLTITGACEAVNNITINGSQIDIGSRITDAPYVEMPDFSETIRLQAEQANQSYSGGKNFNGSNVSVQSPIYVDGDLTVNGSRFSGKGTIVATGNITFNGSNLLNSGEDAVCFYSKNGNITINGSGINLEGIVYAPKGTITMNGSQQTIQGRVIGNQVTINGSNLSITSGANDLKSLPTHGVKLTM